MENKKVKENNEIMTMEEAAVVDIATTSNAKDSMPTFYKKLLEGKMFVTSLSAESFDDKMTLMEVSSSDEVDNISKVFGVELKVNDIYIEAVEINQDDGSKERVPRVVFITTDGDIYTTVSKGITNKLSNLLSIFGLPKWERPITFIFKEKKLEKGKRMNTFDVK